MPHAICRPLNMIKCSIVAWSPPMWCIQTCPWVQNFLLLLFGPIIIRRSSYLSLKRQSLKKVIIKHSRIHKEVRKKAEVEVWRLEPCMKSVSKWKYQQCQQAGGHPAGPTKLSGRCSFFRGILPAKAWKLLSHIHMVNLFRDSFLA